MSSAWPNPQPEGHIIDCPVLHDEDGECSDECGAWRDDPDHARDAAVSDELRRSA